MNDELVIEFKHILIGVVMVVLAIAFVIGIAVTPYVHGQPLLLTPENRMVKGYLDGYSKYVLALEQEHTNLTALLSPSRPSANIVSVFELSQKARTSQANLNALARTVEQTRVPGGLAALDQALRGALVAELALADKVLVFVGRADETTRNDALVAADEAKTKITTARQLIKDTLR